MHLRLWQKALILSILLLLIVTGSVAWWIAGIDISRLENPLPEPTYIYDRNGQVVSQLSASKLEPVPLEEIPLALRNAIIAVEDKRFYDHTGVDLQAIARALFQDLKSGDLVQGGSTLTQQLAKNLFLSSEKSLGRKLKEAAIAIKIELTYEKDEILEMYLNQIYFGEGTWGVQAAAKAYFGKDVKDLTLAESALLAALPKAPTRYSPLKNKEMAMERRNLVLSLMKEQGYITEEEFRHATAEPLHLADHDDNDLRGRFASYVDHVIEEAVQLYGFTEEQLLTGGLRIYTEMDSDIQKNMEAVFKEDRFFPESSADQPVQSGAVILDPYTGGIRGLVGNRGEHVFRGFNRATQLKRQPGSTFKPIAVYAPALEKGYTPGSVLYDGPLNINGYAPQNYDGRTHGLVTLHEALVHSLNIPAVWLLNEIGVEEGVAFAKKLGIPLTERDHNLGIALGGLSEGVSPLQLAQAYSAFPNLGTLVQAHAITKITTKDGFVLIEAKPKQTKVMSEETAYTMTLLLQDVVAEGTGKRAALDRPVAGKTGTTQLPDTKEFQDINGVKDAWFVGYTPEYVGAVWMGYDKTDRNHVMNTTGGMYPALVFREILTRSLKDVPVSAFKQPEHYRASWRESWPEPHIDPGLLKNDEPRHKKPEKGKGKRKKKEDDD